MRVFFSGGKVENGGGLQPFPAYHFTDSGIINMDISNHNSSSNTADFASLGTNTKYSSTLNHAQPLQAVALSGFEGAKKLPDFDVIRANRALRYEMQATARKLMLLDSGASGKLTLAQLNKSHRVTKCRMVRVANYVSVHKSPQFETCFYGGLALCGSVWGCPVCAAKIQERRRAEVSIAINSAYASDLQCSMITLTAPHYIFDTCSDLLVKQSKALKSLRGSRAYRDLLLSVGYVGLIRALEVVHGGNGWHPHTHEIWFHKPLSDRAKQRFLSAVRALWFTACWKSDLIPDDKIQAFKKHAVDIRFNCSCGDYLAKTADQSYWGADSEITRTSLKTKTKGSSPFALLAAANSDEPGSEKSGVLFVEYLKAFHGKRQLFWSKGMKDRFLIEEKSDEALATEQTENAELIDLICPLGWELVRLNNARTVILDLAETGGFLAVNHWFILHGLRYSSSTC